MDLVSTVDVVELLSSLSGMLLPSFVERVPARCCYLSDAAAPDASLSERQACGGGLARTHGYAVKALPAFVGEAEHARLKEDLDVLYSDAYLAAGSTGFGSGRCVFSGEYQLKGVGRTSFAVLRDFYRDMHGGFFLGDALYEAAVERVFAKVLGVPTVPVDFVLEVFPGPSDRRYGVLGRRGSPLRLAHLHLISARAARFTRAEQQRFWQRLLGAIFGINAEGEATAADACCRLILDKALDAVAQARVFGLSLGAAADNYDIFGRYFEVSEAHFYYPRLPAGEALESVNELENTLLQIHRSPAGAPASWYLGTLEPLSNAFSLIRLMEHNVPVDAAVWLQPTTVLSAYEDSVQRALAAFATHLGETPEPFADYYKTVFAFDELNQGESFDWVAELGGKALSDGLQALAPEVHAAARQRAKTLNESPAQDVALLPMGDDELFEFFGFPRT